MTAKKSTGEFIGYTIGLECWINNRLKMVKCEYTRAGDGVRIHAVSGHSLGRFDGGHSKVISKEEFRNRPDDPYDDIVEAIWALEQIGLSPSGLP